MKATKVPVLNDVHASDLAELVFEVMRRLEVGRRMDNEDCDYVMNYRRILDACLTVMEDECPSWED